MQVSWGSGLTNRSYPQVEQCLYLLISILYAKWSYWWKLILPFTFLFSCLPCADWGTLWNYFGKNRPHNVWLWGCKLSKVAAPQLISKVFHEEQARFPSHVSAVLIALLFYKTPPYDCNCRQIDHVIPVCTMVRTSTNNKVGCRYLVPVAVAVILLSS